MKKMLQAGTLAPAMLGSIAFVAVLPLLLHGPSCGHDFDFHILSWLEAANQFTHLGYPHWAFTPAWNAGEPRFVFYPPLSWALGAFLGLVLPWNFVPAAFTWVALTLSGLITHQLTRRIAGPQAALLAATLYMANPYMLFTAYERTAYGELLAAAWLPLLFSAVFAERVTILRLAFPIALLWLTNAPAGVMGCYTLAFLTTVRLCTPQSSPHRLLPASSRLRLALTTAAGTALGLALTGFYLVPAAYEQRFVQVNMAIIPGMRPQEHFLFHRMGANSFDDLFHDQVVRTASIVALMILAGIAVALVVAWRSKSLPSSLFPLPWLTLLIAFLLTPPSLFLWNHIPKLAFLQFPWRLTALLGVILAISVAKALDRFKPSLPSSLLPVPLALLLVFPAWHFFQQPCDPEDTVPARVALFHSNAGTEPTDEYTPKVDDNDALGHADPPYWLLPSSCPLPGPNGTTELVPMLSATGGPPPNAKPGQAPTHLVLDLAQPGYLVLNRRKFPFWQVLVNGHSPNRSPLPPALGGSLGKEFPLPSLLWNIDQRRQSRTDGLIVVSLPAGHSTIDLVYRRTPDQTAGLGLSGISALIAIGLTRKRRLD